MGIPHGQINASKIKLPSTFNNKYVRCDGSGILIPKTLAEFQSELGITGGGITQADLDTAIATRQPLDSDLTAIADLVTTTYGRSKLIAFDAASERLATNGRDIQYGATKPTTRSTGTSLQNGDFWWDTTNDWWAFFNGATSSWLTQQIFSESALTTATISVTANIAFGAGVVPTATLSLFLIDWSVNTFMNAVHDTTTNFYTVNLQRAPSTGSTVNVSTISLARALASGSVTVNLSANINTSLASALGIAGWRINIVKSGTAGNLTGLSARIRYRLAYV